MDEMGDFLHKLEGPGLTVRFGPVLGPFLVLRTRPHSSNNEGQHDEGHHNEGPT